MTTDSRRPAEGRVTRLPPLYPIIDIDVCRLRGLEPGALAAACVAGGARLLQIRQKGHGTGAFVETARRIAAEGRRAGALLIVNDRADVAALAGAGGVHVGQTDLPVEAVRPIVGPGLIVGVSTHTREQVDEAAATDVDYIAVGPVFETATKDTGYDPRGLDLVRYAADRGKPVVAIGGITVERARAVREAGAASLAVISDLFVRQDPEARVREYLEALA